MNVLLESLKTVILIIALLVIAFGLMHFMTDMYLYFYRLYYDSNYLTQIKNNISLFTAKYLPF